MGDARLRSSAKIASSTRLVVMCPTPITSQVSIRVFYAGRKPYRASRLPRIDSFDNAIQQSVTLDQLLQFPVCSNPGTSALA